MKIEPAQTDETSIRELAEFLLPMASEMAIYELSPKQAFEQLYLTVAAEMTLIARDDEGEIIGSIALVEAPIWYANATYLIDQWFYVAPGARFGVVGVRLLRAARDLGEKRDKAVFVKIVNPHRRPKVTKAGLYAQVAGFVPLAHMTRLR